MDQASRIFLQPDFGNSDMLFPAVKHNIHGALRAKFDG
jgi:hypothetical protein